MVVVLAKLTIARECTMLEVTKVPVQCPLNQSEMVALFSECMPQSDIDRESSIFGVVCSNFKLLIYKLVRSGSEAPQSL